MATITVNELAVTLESDPRTTRKFLRSITPKDEQPGKGSRWSIEKKSVRSLTAQFKKWTAENEAAKAEREAQAAKDATPEVEVETDEVIEDAVDAELDGDEDSTDEVDGDEADDAPMPKHAD